VTKTEVMLGWQTDVRAASNAERVRLLYALSRSTVVANFATAILVATWLWDSVNRSTLVGWLIAMALNVGATVFLYFYFQKKQPKPQDSPLWEHYFAIRAVFAGVVWGLLIWLILPSTGEFERIVVVLALSMASLGVCAVFSPSRLAYYGFMTPVLILATPSLISSSSFEGLTAASWGILIYLAMLFSVHDLLFRNFCSTFLRRFESEALALEHTVIFNSAAEAIALVRPRYVAKCNRQWCELFGYELDEAAGKPPWDIFPSYEYWAEFTKNCQLAIAAGRAYSAVVQLRRTNGELFWAEISGMAVDPKNLKLGVVWMGTDISQRLRTEAELIASEQRFRDLVSLSTDWYWEQDENFRFTHVSGLALERIGLSTTAPIGKTRWEIKGILGVSEAQWQAHKDTLENQQPFQDFIYEAIMPNKGRSWFSISGTPAYDENGEFCGYHGVGTDITDRVKAAEQFRHLAHHDTLTGLPNRRLLNDRLEQALAIARRKNHQVAMMLLDLDNFKTINDTEGHSAGDTVLITIAKRLEKIVRETDTVSRLGGDEFVILLPEMAGVSDAIRVAEKIVEAILEPVEAGGKPYVMGVSIGIAIFPEHAADAEDLLKLADIAMYEAKRGGGSGYKFAKA